MKTPSLLRCQRRGSLILQGLLLIFLVSQLQLAALPTPLCALKHAASMLDRGVTQWRQKLTDALDERIYAVLSGSTPPKRQSWAAITDPEDRAIQAGMDIEACMDRAEQIATSPGPGIGNETANAFTDALTSQRVLMSGTSLDDVGAGLGLASRHPLLAKDSDLAQVIKGNETVLQSGVFKDRGYTDAEFWRDWKTCFEDNPALPINGPDFKKNLLAGQASTRHEIRVAAHYKKSKGHEIQVVAGADFGNSAATKADTLTDKAYIQSGETGGTIQRKLEKESDDLVNAIIEARTKNKSFDFAHSDNDPDWRPTINARADMNNALATKYGVPDHENPFKTYTIKDPANPTQRIHNNPLTEEGFLKACADFDPVGDRRFPNDTARIVHVPLE
jgi:hypothetical protein